jgi:hypothetical protein
MHSTRKGAFKKNGSGLGYTKKMSTIGFRSGQFRRQKSLGHLKKHREISYYVFSRLKNIKSLTSKNSGTLIVIE